MLRRRLGKRSRADGDARRVFLASIIYLPLVLGLMVADRPAARSAGAGTERVVAAAGPGFVSSTSPNP